MSRTATQCDETQAPSGSEVFDEHATHCEIERVLREYIDDYYKPHMARHDRAFAPGTIRLAESVMPLLDHLDEGRKAVH